jgi:hypothetical protein
MVAKKKVVRFTTRETPNGCTVEVVWPSGRKQVKRFRNGYAHSTLAAKRWICDQVSVIAESVQLGDVPVLPDIYVNSELLSLQQHWRNGNPESSVCVCASFLF